MVVELYSVVSKAENNMRKASFSWYGEVSKSKLPASPQTQIQIPGPVIPSVQVSVLRCPLQVRKNGKSGGRRQEKVGFLMLHLIFISYTCQIFFPKKLAYPFTQGIDRATKLIHSLSLPFPFAPFMPSFLVLPRKVIGFSSTDTTLTTS